MQCAYCGGAIPISEPDNAAGAESDVASEQAASKTPFVPHVQPIPTTPRSQTSLAVGLFIVPIIIVLVVLILLTIFSASHGKQPSIGQPPTSLPVPTATSAAAPATGFHGLASGALASSFQAWAVLRTPTSIAFSAAGASEYQPA